MVKVNTMVSFFFFKQNFMYLFERFCIFLPTSCTKFHVFFCKTNITFFYHKSWQLYIIHWRHWLVKKNPIGVYPQKTNGSLNSVVYYFFLCLQHPGYMKFASDTVLNEVTQNHLAPIRYVDDQGHPTTQYPLNPNGSPLGVAALCSPDGRHLALMPHPERCTFTWQWAWMPPAWKQDLKASPWMRMFKNACAWCCQKV